MLLQNFCLRQHCVSTTVRALSAALVLLSCPFAGCPCALGQTDPNQPASSTSNTANIDPATNSKTWIVRDPATGRLYQQRLVAVSVPVTRWEAKTVEQTVYEPQVTTTVQQPQQPLYVPKTQYVMQPKVRGWWNPLKQPVQAYEFTPITQWAPTPAAPQTIAAQQWVPKQQKIVVYQPVQSTEVRQQLVQVELPQPTTVTANSLRPGMQPRAFAGNMTQPLLRLPFFATNEQARIARTQWPYNQQVAPSQIASNPARVPSITSQTANPPAAPPTASPTSSQPAPPSAQPPVLPPQYATNQHSSSQYAANQSPLATSPAYLPPPQPSYTSGLRPIAASFPPVPSIPVPRFATRPYNAPLQPVASGGSAYTRDTLQSGMQPTVLR